MAKRHLVKQHLENVSGEMLAQHRDLIAAYAKGRGGIYILYSDRRMYYVGLASNLAARLNRHLRDRHAGKWNRFSLYITRSDGHMRELEALLHRTLRPEGNRQIGRLVGSQDLRRPLRLEMRQKQRDQLAELMGERVRVTRRLRSNRSGSSRSVAAKRAAASRRALQARARPMGLRAWHDGYEYSARLGADGSVIFNGETYRSPSGAASAIAGRRQNGLNFWHFRNGKGEWVRLRELLV